ncbi:MAG TPA: DUF6551 family protein [Massilibacterium sp.]|nr:DUF6551 family protein [Massilibacterium sp.]
MQDILKDKVKYFSKMPVSLLRVDHSYQKPLTMSHVNKISDNFDPMGVGQIHVSKRSDGTYYIFDGQHRWTVYKIKGIEVIDCIVYEDLTIEEEAKAYDFYNTIKTQSPLDKEKALVVAGDKDAIKRKKIVEGLGLEIDYQRTNRIEYIQAVGAINAIYQKGDDGELSTVLHILHRSLGKHKKNFQGMILLGLHQFIKEYKGRFDENWLINRLTKFGLDELLTEQMTFRRAHNCSKAEAIKYAIVKFYNHGKRKDNKL